jgi:hypothetical protein
MTVSSFSSWLCLRGVYSLTASDAPSLRPLVPSGSLIGCQSVQFYHHHPAFPIDEGRSYECGQCSLCFRLLLRCIWSRLSFRMGPTPPEYPVIYFRNLMEVPNVLCAVSRFSRFTVSLKISLTLPVLSSRHRNVSIYHNIRITNCSIMDNIGPHVLTK